MTDAQQAVVLVLWMLLACLALLPGYVYRLVDRAYRVGEPGRDVGLAVGRGQSPPGRGSPRP